MSGFKAFWKKNRIYWYPPEKKKKENSLKEIRSVLIKYQASLTSGLRTINVHSLLD